MTSRDAEQEDVKELRPGVMTADRDEDERIEMFTLEQRDHDE